MKIIQINKLYYPHIGGVERTVKLLAEGFAGFGWESEVLACQEKGARQVETVNGVKVWRAKSWGRISALPLSWDFFRLFKKNGPTADILLFHEPFPWGALAYCLFRPKAKIFVFYHSDIIRQKIAKWFFYPFLFRLLRRADKIFVGSHNLIGSSAILTKFKAKIRVVPFGVDFAKLIPDSRTPALAAALKEKYGPFILTVGRLVYYKGFEYLVEAMKTSPHKLLIIGEGPLREELARQIQKNNLADRVFLSGRVDDLRPYYEACKFFVFPSVANSEAFGLVQAEAMFFGKPVINTDLPTGVPEVSVDQESGLTVPVKDSHALSRAINLLWADEDLYARLAAGAYRRSRIYSPENFLEAMRKNMS